MSKTKKILRGPEGLAVELDRSQVFTDDPGQGTPAMATLGRYAATLAYAQGEGELLGTVGGVTLTEEQTRWLDSVEDQVESFLYGEAS